MSVVTFTASAYAAELLLTFSDNTPITPVMTRLERSRDKKGYAAELTRRFGNHVDIRTPTEVIADFRQKGVDAVPIVTPRNHLFINEPDGSVTSAISLDEREVIPLASVSNRVTLLCNEDGRWIDYRSDRFGFSNPDDIWQAGHLDIAAVGDSFAQGYCVPADKNFVALIRQRYIATLNLGMAGHGPLLMLATLKEYVPRFRPPVVLWFYCEGNDLTGLHEERKSALLTHYLKDDFTQRELGRQHDIDRAIEAEMPRLVAEEQERAKRRAVNESVYGGVAFAKLTTFRQTLGLVGETDSGDLDMMVDLETRNMDVFREILHQASAKVDEWDGQLYFVYLPEWTRYTSYQSYGKTKRDAVLALVRKLDIPLIDLDPVFKAHGDPLSLFPFREVGHYNETGHRLVAEEVLRRLPSSNRTDTH